MRTYIIVMQVVMLALACLSWRQAFAGESVIGGGTRLTWLKPSAHFDSRLGT